MVEFGLGGYFGSGRLTAWKNALNDVYRAQIKTSHHQAMYGEPKMYLDFDLSDARPKFI
jgi:hypothetical protein